MKGIPIRELATVIRSKNSGPFELTFDLIFRDRDTYRQIKESGFFTPELFARLYGIPVQDVVSLVEFDPANAIKCTIKRPRGAGDIGETDVYGAQQHAPLLTLKIPTTIMGRYDK